MSKEIREMIDKVKNFKQFVNENINSDKKYYHSTFGRYTLKMLMQLLNTKYNTQKHT